jgi:ABC-type glycerol-3-phosphate transport system substrate-binding protein
MKFQKVQKMSLALFVSALALSGCGGKSVSEKVTEKAIEAQTGVEIDQDEDGSMTMKTKDGTVESGTGKVPDGFPKEIALPKGKVTTSMTAKVDGKKTWMVTFESDDVSKAAKEVKAAWEKAGFKIETDLDQNTDGNQTTMVLAKKGDATVIGMGEQTSGEKGSFSVSVEKPE